jgi:hypothetical protein
MYKYVPPNWGSWGAKTPKVFLKEVNIYKKNVGYPPPTFYTQWQI